MKYIIPDVSEWKTKYKNMMNSIPTKKVSKEPTQKEINEALDEMAIWSAKYTLENAGYTVTKK